MKVQPTDCLGQHIGGCDKVYELYQKNALQGLLQK
jgi:glutaredoxin-related protein